MGAMMHDCVKWGLTGQRALKQAKSGKRSWNWCTPKRQYAHDAHSCPFSKFIITEVSQGGVAQMCLTKRLHLCTRTAVRAYDDELGQCEQDLCKYPAGHSREQQAKSSCLLPRVLALHSFPAQQRNNTSAGVDDQVQNRCPQNR